MNATPSGGPIRAPTYLGNVVANRQYDIPLGAAIVIYGNNAGGVSVNAIPRGGPPGTTVPLYISFQGDPLFGSLWSSVTFLSSQGGVPLYLIDERIALQARRNQTNVNANQSGTWTVGVNNFPTTYGGPTVSVVSSGVFTAGAAGLATVTVKATSGDEITLEDFDSQTEPLTSSATGDWQTFQFPVVSGKAYTLAGTGLVVLGNSAVIG